SPLSVIGIVTNADCSGGNDGEIDITISGGTSNYTVSWNADNGFTSSFQDISNLAVGTYRLDITDANGCSLNGTEFTLTEPTALVLTPTVVSPSCGLSDGSVSVTAVGGTVTTNYSYVWVDLTTGTTLPVVVDNISNISSGNFEVTVTD